MFNSILLLLITIRGIIVSLNSIVQIPDVFDILFWEQYVEISWKIFGYM